MSKKRVNIVLIIVVIMLFLSSSVFLFFSYFHNSNDSNVFSTDKIEIVSPGKNYTLVLNVQYGTKEQITPDDESDINGSVEILYLNNTGKNNKNSNTFGTAYLNIQGAFDKDNYSTKWIDNQAILTLVGSDNSTKTYKIPLK